MTLAEVRDWLKTLGLAERYYIGRLDAGTEKALAVYPRARRAEPVMALGGIGNSSYGVLGVTLLLHWNKNAAETEAAAARVWDAVSMAAGADTPGGGHIQYVRPAVPAPVGVGRDGDGKNPGGVYEYVIDFDIYYRRPER